jgi:hypothetical protein
VADLLGICLWCSREVAWDHHAGGWRHTESGSLLCHDGSRAVLDTDTNRVTLATLRRTARESAGDSRTETESSP